MKKPTAIDYICASVAVMLIGVLLVIMCAGCGHNVSQVGMGSAFRLGSGEFSLSYTDGLFLNSVNRENMSFEAELDSTVGASYDPVTGTFKGIKSIAVETGPQITGYTADLAKQSPEAVAAYYDALKAYYQAKAGKPAQPLISDEKSKEASESVSDILKAAIEKAAGKVSEGEKPAEEADTIADDCSDGSCDILPALGAAASALLTDTSTEYRWYYHSATVNQTAEALTAALDNKCGLLVFVGKPGCHICEAVWSSSYDGTAMMDGAGKMAAYLKSHSLVGLKIEDSQSHFGDLAAETMGWRNPDGTATNTNAPFLVLVKVKEGKGGETSLSLSPRSGDIEVFFGGYGSLVMYDKTYAKISAWLDGMLASDRYREAWQ